MKKIITKSVGVGWFLKTPTPHKMQQLFDSDRVGFKVGTALINTLDHKKNWNAFFIYTYISTRQR